MAGLETSTSGQVTLLGQTLNDCSEDQRAQIRAQQVGFIFQNFQPGAAQGPKGVPIRQGS